MNETVLYIISAVLTVILLTGCRQKMHDTPRYEAYEASGLFDDSSVMRHPVPGTVPRDADLESRYGLDESGLSGQDVAGAGDAFSPGQPVGSAGQEQVPPRPGSALSGFPIDVTRGVLERGRNRFDIYCSPCHGRVGDGRGIIVERGLRRPPSFHTDRLRNAPAYHFFDVITEGYGAMYSYAGRVKPADRWAIAAYIRALQVSRHTDITDVPLDSAAVQGERVTNP